MRQSHRSGHIRSTADFFNTIRQEQTSWTHKHAWCSSCAAHYNGPWPIKELARPRATRTPQRAKNPVHNSLAGSCCEDREPFVADQRSELERRHWPTEEIALYPIARRQRQDFGLRFGLDALCHNLHVKIVGQCHQRLDQDRIPAAGNHLAHEALVDLETGDR